MPCASASVEARTRSSSSVPRVAGGRTHAESPEWMPASSTCSMMPPRYMSSPSKSASTSISRRTSSPAPRASAAASTGGGVTLDSGAVLTAGAITAAGAGCRAALDAQHYLAAL